ncbi:hypothetical protein Q5752_005551 [Cryptotrichosporon argae]
MFAPLPPVVEYLRSLTAVRDRSAQVFDLVVAGKADHWDWHADKLDVVVDYCANIIERDFGKDYAKVTHCRRNHFSPSRDRIASLLAHPAFPTDPVQRAATLIDLYLVSVLLDAGAGNAWVYTEVEDGNEVWKGGRSEGLAVASYRMFVEGVFSSVESEPLRVDGQALKALTPEILAKHLQVSDANPMAGLEGRTALLMQLGAALEARPDICPNGRPGEILTFFAPTVTSQPEPVLPLFVFWSTLFDLLSPIWPSRTTLPSHPRLVLGDVWPCPALDKHLAASGAARAEGDSLVPFHKLTQWLCYSLVEAIESEAGWKVDRGQGQTGLPEYRNGGLLVDHGLISIRPDSLPADAYPNGKDCPPVLAPSHPAVVEWRAVTVITLDKIHQELTTKLGVAPDELSLAQVLEAATWKGGREIAQAKREGGGPPVEIISDGTVF